MDCFEKVMSKFDDLEFMIERYDEECVWKVL